MWCIAHKLIFWYFKECMFVYVFKYVRGCVCVCVCMCVYICECICVCMREREREREKEKIISSLLYRPPPSIVGEVWRGMVVIDVDARRGDGKWFLSNLPARMDPRHHFIISPTLATRHVDGVLIISGEGGFYYRRPSPLFAGVLLQLLAKCISVFFSNSLNLRFSLIVHPHPRPVSTP